jgi:hypothetical protein
MSDHLKTPPAAFQRLADSAIGGNRYINLQSLWDYLRTKNPALAAKIDGTSPKGNLPSTTIQAVQGVMQSMKNAKKHKSKSKGGGAPTQVPRAAASKKTGPGGIQPADMDLIGIEDSLWASDGAGGLTPAKLVDACDFGPDNVGVCVMSATKAIKTLRMYEFAELFSGAAAIICKKVAYQEMMCKENRELMGRFPHTTCQLFFLNKARAPVEVECVMFQLGNCQIKYDDLTKRAQEVAPELSDATKVSIKIPNLDSVANFGKDVKATFQKTATTAIGGAKVLYKDTLPFHTNTYDDMVWKGDTISTKILPR